MNIFLIYLAIGAASFWPMVKMDKECREYIKAGGKKTLIVSVIIWCLFWSASLILDFLFWALEKDDDK